MSNDERITGRRVIRALQRRLLDRRYPMNAFRGVYRDFAEAQRAAPATKPVGYDSAHSEDWYENKLHEVFLEDYPVLFWLRAALAGSCSVFEIGGHTGEAYYGFCRLLEYPPHLAWTILDVPTIAAKGEAMARERGATNLAFVRNVAEVDGADIVFASGALQYIDTPSLAETIAAFRTKPRHVLINVTPMYDGPAFVTLQNVGTVYCPYRVFNRRELVQSLERLGYSLVDAWKTNRAFSIRGHPERAFDHYSGLYLRA
jgi:putative methyltransferase (TIGR04325 family)